MKLNKYKTIERIAYRLKFIKIFWLKATVMVFTGIFLVGSAKAQTPELSWPTATNVSKPWAFWHWMGNAVDTTDIASQLVELNKGGIGGVLNVQLLDCDDPGAAKVPYLSFRWVSIMRYTINKARSLGMDMDMCATTGWEWGGPWISSADAASRQNITTFTLVAGGKLTSTFFNRFCFNPSFENPISA